MALGSSRERMLRKHKKREKGDSALSKAQGVREARYRKARKLLKNAIAKVTNNRNIIIFYYYIYTSPIIRIL